MYRAAVVDSVVWRIVDISGRCVFITVGEYSILQTVETSGCFETVSSEDCSFKQRGLFQIFSYA